MSEVQLLTDLISKNGVLPLALLVIVALVREVQRLRKEMRQWRNLALGSQDEASRAAALAEFFRGEA